MKYLSKNLTTLGYEHVLCTNGKEALDKYTEDGSEIDAVIIDMSMPVMGKFFQKARHLPRTTCIANLVFLFFSAYHQRWSGGNATDA